MKSELTPITAGRLSSLWANIPGYDLAERFVDLFAARQRLRIIVTSDGYRELRILGGLIEFSAGSKREFLIEGPPGFCEAWAKNLRSGTNVASTVLR